MVQANAESKLYMPPVLKYTAIKQRENGKGAAAT